MTDNAPQIVARQHPLSPDHQVVPGTVGKSVAETIDEYAEKYGVKGFYQSRTYVEINGRPLLPEKYDSTYLTADSHVLIQFRVPEGGDKDPLAIFLSLAVIVVAPYLGEILGPMMLPASASADAFLFAEGLATGLITMGGMALVGMLVPPPQYNNGLGSDPMDDTNVYSVTGMRNQLALWRPLPMVLGTMRFTPPYGAVPYTRIEGEDQLLHCDFIWGAGELSISDIKIGETAITSFTDYQISTNSGTDSDPELNLYPNDVWEDNVSAVLSSGVGVERTAQADANVVGFDFVFAKGLFRLNDQGKRQNATVTVEIYSRQSGTADPWLLEDTYNYTSKSNTPQRFNEQLAASGTMDFKVVRTTADKDPANDKLYDEITWGIIRSTTYQDPVSFPTPVAETQLIIKTTDQLAGVIDNLNAVVSTVCLDYEHTTDTWVKRATNNPASLFRHVYQGAGTAKPLPDNQLDIAALEEWHDFCRLNGFSYNFVHDAQSSVISVINDICHAGRATRVELGDQRSVVIDQPKATGAVQMFVEGANLANFKATKTFLEELHGYRVAFNNQEADYIEDEVMVYAEGYSAANATLIEALEFRGVTDPDHAAKLAKYHLAIRKYRPEVFTWETDWEQLVCNRGDLIKVASSAILVGDASGRITAIDTVNKEITLDQNVTFDTGPFYLTLRTTPDTGRNSEVATVQVTGTGTTNIVDYGSETLPTGLAVGDLYTFGEPLDCLVTSKRPGSGMKATITAIPYSWTEITAYLAGGYPDYDSGVTVPTYVSPLIPLAPTIISITGGREAALTLDNGTIIPRIILMVRLYPGGKVPASYVHAEIRQSDGWERSATTNPNQPIIFDNVEVGDADIRVRAVSEDGRVSSWVYDTYTQVTPSWTPSAILSLTVTGNLFENDLEWVLPDDYRQTYRVEVWCATGTNDRAGATRVVQLSGGTKWNHTGLNKDVTYYYWMKVIGDTGVESAWYPVSDTGGIQASPIGDATKILDMLTGQLDDSHLTAALNAEIDSGGADMAFYEGVSGDNGNLYLLKLADQSYTAGMGIIIYPDWSTGLSIALDDLYWHTGEGALYKCILAHTSETTTNEPPHVTYWEEITNGVKSEIQFQSDMFAIKNASSGGTEVPFVVNGTTIGIDGTLVVDGTIVSTALATQGVTTWTVQSENYQAGTQGFKLDSTTGTIDFTNNVTQWTTTSENNVTFISRPTGGSNSFAGNGLVGAIKIRLPQWYTNTMLTFTVDVFDYTTYSSFSLKISGYTYANGPNWTRISANLSGSTLADNAVRFGNDGTKCCVWIGEISSTWNHVKVVVRDVMVSYANYAVDDWKDGWDIGMPTAWGTVDATITDALIDANKVNFVGNTAATTIESWADDPAARINANTTTIEGGKITTGSVTATQLYGTNLASLYSTTGALTVNSSLTLNTAGHIKSGKTSYLSTAAGTYIGYYNSYHRLNIGNATRYIKWTGTDLLIGGDIVATGNIEANGITVMNSTYVAGSVGSSTSAETTIGSVTISVTSGDRVLLIFNCQSSANYENSSMDYDYWTTGTIYLYRGTELLQSWSRSTNGGNVGEEAAIAALFQTRTFTDVITANTSYTYQFRFKGDSEQQATLTLTASKRNMSAIRMKR